MRVCHEKSERKEIEYDRFEILAVEIVQTRTNHTDLSRVIHERDAFNNLQPRERVFAAAGQGVGVEEK